MTMTLEQATGLVRGLLHAHPRGVAVREAWEVIDAHLTQPAQLVDIKAIREVIAHLRSFRSNTPPTWAHLDDAADKLTAALQEGEG